jgi:Flp pilus assembly pilin Flp
MSTRSVRSVRLLVATFMQDDSGQDLIEYALLTAIIGIAGILSLQAFAPKMATAYLGWNTKMQDAWEVCAPLLGACPGGS